MGALPLHAAPGHCGKLRPHPHADCRHRGLREQSFAVGKNPLEHPSWFHMLAGYLVFIVALLGMMGAASLLGRLSGEKLPATTCLFSPEAPSHDGDQY